MDEIPKNHFDVIVASHEIKHLAGEDLGEVLTHLVAALNVGGRMLIEAPQAGHSYLDINGSRQDPHTLFFTLEALATAVRRAGGKVLFEGTRSGAGTPRREAPIYEPTNRVYDVTKGRVTVICGR